MMRAAVAIAYSVSSMVHLIGLALWLGGIVFFLVVLGPAVHELEPKLAIKTLNRGRIGFETASWIGIALLLLSGIFNLAALAQGADLPSGWGIFLSVKLLLFGAMIVHHSLQVFKYGPAISNLTAQPAHDRSAWPEPLLSQWRRWFLLLKINAALGPIVMLLGLALTQS